MKNNSNIFERMLRVAVMNGLKNANDLSKALGYKSPEKLYRLEREPNAKPSVDIITDFSNLFENLDIRWLLTGSGSPFNTAGEITRTPVDITENNIATPQESTYSAPPTFSKIAPPSAPPTLGLPKIITVNEDQNELIPLVNVKVAAGYLNGYADAEYLEKLPTIRMPGIKSGTHRAFEVSGSSMMPTLHHRSVAVGRWVEDFSDIIERYIYIVVSKSEGVVIKRVLNRIEERQELVLVSDNPNKDEFPNIYLPADEVLELWRLRGAFSFEFPEPKNDRLNDMEARLTSIELLLRGQKLL